MPSERAPDDGSAFAIEYELEAADAAFRVDTEGAESSAFRQTPVVSSSSVAKEDA